MGHLAQRDFVVQALKAAVDGNIDIREEGYNFNLLTCPGYPELIVNLVSLNNDRANTGFIIGDLPMSLPATIADINSYENSFSSVSDPYVGLFYPSALSTDLSGNEIAVPASHMMLRTFIRSDNVSYQWFAPAGTRRGLIDNATALGYINNMTGNFIRSGISQGIRDTLYERRMNPVTLLPGAGIVAYGQKTRATAVGGGGTSMDRINVARLVNYLRVILKGVANQFLFEPNDKITRDQVKQMVESMLNDLIAKRGIYDYLVVCDETNNTSDRIARNELYVDIAIEPMKAVEFIYIPIRLKNPGTITGGASAVAAV
jgi:phage tail sheath protein FI